MSDIRKLFEEGNYEAVIEAEALTENVDYTNRVLCAKAHLKLRDYNQCKEVLLSALNLCNEPMETEELSPDGITAIFDEAVKVSVAHIEALLALYGKTADKAHAMAIPQITTDFKNLLTEVSKRADLISMSPIPCYEALVNMPLVDFLLAAGQAMATYGNTFADEIVADFTADRKTATTTEAGMSALAWFIGLNEKEQTTEVILEYAAGLTDLVINHPFFATKQEDVAQRYAVIIPAQHKLLTLSKKGVSGGDVYLLDEGSATRQKAVSRFTQYVSQMKKADPEYQAPALPQIAASAPTAATKKSGGCYVATAVYGSYDCPQVWTLRRYRDNTLDATRFGRLFIRVYYAVSPTLVKCFGKARWFRRFCQAILDPLVKKLQARGFAATPYNDKY